MRRITITTLALISLFVLGSMSVRTIYGQTSVTTTTRSTTTNFSRPAPPPVDPDPRTVYAP